MLAAFAMIAGREREERTREELVGAGVGAVVRAVRVDVAQRQRPDDRAERTGEHCDADRTELPVLLEAARGHEEAAEEERPQQVELLLDRE